MHGSSKAALKRRLCETSWELIGKSKLIYSTIPRKIIINRNVIFEEKRIANAFNNFFIDIGSDLADGIPAATRSFKSYVQKPIKQ